MPKKKKPKEVPKSKFEELEFFRLRPNKDDPNPGKIFKVIPRYLFEQIEAADDETIERIRLAGQIAIQNPTTLIYILIDGANIIKGILWCCVNLIDAALFVKVFSVDKEYQGGSLKAATDFLIEQIKDSKVTRLECYSMRPKSAERSGWKKSKQIHLEYEVDHETETPATED